MGSAYTSGVIAAKEIHLLGNQLEKMCAMSAEEAFEVLTESGFGGGEASSMHEIEALVLKDEEDIDRFIRTYAASKGELEYLLSPRDFHNAKALIKAHYLNLPQKPLLASEGIYPVAALKKAVETGDVAGLNKELAGAINAAKARMQGEEEGKGEDVGLLFEKAMFAYLSRVLPSLGILRKLLRLRADMTNLLILFRVGSAVEARRYYVEGGSLAPSTLASALREDAKVRFANTDYKDFVAALWEGKERGAYSKAEQLMGSLEVNYFAPNPYALNDNKKFLYYVFRRRKENTNVRMVLVCLMAGLKEEEIKKRLRG